MDRKKCGLPVQEDQEDLMVFAEVHSLENVETELVSVFVVFAEVDDGEIVVELREVIVDQSVTHVQGKLEPEFDLGC